MIKAFEEMFRKLQPALVRYAAGMLYSTEDAREVVQEVFINVWQKKEKLEFGLELKSYLYRAVRNQTLNKINRAKLDTISLDERLVVFVEENNVDTEEQKQQLRLIFTEVDKLPGSCREIFVMSRMEGLSHAEIAAVLDISTKTVENQIGIALKKIRKGVTQKP